MAVARVRRVGVFSWALQLGLIYFTVGLIVGAVVALGTFFGVALGDVFASSGAGGGRVAGALFGVGAVIAMPLLWGACGFVAGLIGAGLYNLAASVTGGVELELT
jgi:hypothetical protein